MEELIIVPDVHCRDFYKPVLNIKDKPIVFLGDYLDPYPWDGFSFEHGLENLEEIIQFKKNNKQRVTLLIGNHCFNSLWQKNWASRFVPSKKAFALYNENLNLFDPYKVIDNVLFTHAGISVGWLKTNNIEDPIKEIDKEWNEFLLNPTEESYLPIFDCGQIRGGFSKYGGIFWNDLRENNYVNPIDYVQIFGHTQLSFTGDTFDMDKEPFKGKPRYCCDSRSIFIYSNNQLTRYEQN